MEEPLLDDILREAGILAGFPVTKRAVEETESQAMPPLPAHLLDPSVVFNRKQKEEAKCRNGRTNDD